MDLARFFHYHLNITYTPNFQPFYERIRTNEVSKVAYKSIYLFRWLWSHTRNEVEQKEKILECGAAWAN